MAIFRTLASDFQALIPATERGQERFRRLLPTLQAIFVPSQRLAYPQPAARAIVTLFGVSIAEGAIHLHGLGEAAPGSGCGRLCGRASPAR